MKVSLNAGSLMALFPALYSRRENKNADLWDRNWLSLAVPRIRLFGPFWSFVAELNDVTNGPDISVLLEDDIPRDFPGHTYKYHPPSLLRANIQKFWWSNTSPNTQTVRSRRSLTAVYTVDKKHLFLPLDRADCIDQNLTTPLILAPLGNHPKHLGEIFEPETEDAAHLPAMQLVSGVVWFEPAKGYLKKLRDALGLEQPASDAKGANLMALTPLGLAVLGKIRLPWEKESFQGWFILTERGSNDDVSEVLRLWNPPGIDPVWANALDDFARNLPSKTDGSPPHWFALIARTRIKPDDLFWPCSFVSKKTPLLRRMKVDIDSSVVSLEGKSLEPSLQGDEARALSLNAAEFTVSRTAINSIQIDCRNTLQDNKGKNIAPHPLALDATYTLQNEVENVAITQTNKQGDVVPMELALPMQSNADHMRQALGFTPPHPIEDSTSSAPLWLFTPIRDGWLNWPFPNATTALLANDAEDPGPKEETRRSITSGAWRVGAAQDGSERSWSTSIFGAVTAEFSAVLDTSTQPKWKLTTLNLKLAGLSGIFDGLIPVTGFTQSPNQLIPEAEMRALAPLSLRAVSPDLLVSFEAVLWSKTVDGNPAGPRAALRLDRILLTKSGNRTFLKFGNPAAGPNSVIPKLSITWPESENIGKLRPWLWLRHHELPTIQTLPLCVAGNRVTEPSGTREFTPLKGKAPSGRTAEFFFGHKIDMTVPFANLNIKKMPDTWQHPLAETSWQNEVGQVFITLGTVSVFLSDGGRHTVNYNINKQQFGPVKLAQSIDYRHDLATTDELHALASLPPPNPKEQGVDQPAPAGTLFQPGRWNDPDISNLRGSVWLDVWADLNRKLALAATERRELVTNFKRNNKVHYKLSNTLLDQSFELENLPTLNTNIVFSTDAPEWQETGDPYNLIGHFGQFELALQSKDHKAGTVQARGLPSTEDLSGLNLLLQRLNPDGKAHSSVQIDLGTLRQTARKGTPLRDQAGWIATIGKSDVKPPILIRKMQRPNTSTGDIHLVSLREPQKITLSEHGSSLIRIALFDLPCTKAKDNLLFERKDQNTSDGLRAEINPENGYSWALLEDGMPDHVMVGQLAFRATELSAATFAKDGSLARLRFDGRISVPLPGDNGEGIKLAEAIGDASLEIIWNSNKPTFKLFSYGRIELPLADPERIWPPTPWLHIEKLNYSGSQKLGGKSARLVASSHDLALELDVTLNDTKGDDTVVPTKANTVVLAEQSV
ncbi:MAG: hypothetical protein JKY45_11795, partial [Emcibacter sp.]|nr:hypothetical protein [Emcibacter sp.]